VLLPYLSPFFNVYGTPPIRLGVGANILCPHISHNFRCMDKQTQLRGIHGGGIAGQRRRHRKVGGSRAPRRNAL
ncbi:MAG: hypothetical protein II723_03135, partial [Oscillospiraceae bacterium]|nr:hypothetical protein [Oscillospiraceae bacterium]